MALVPCNLNLAESLVDQDHFCKSAFHLHQTFRRPAHESEEYLESRGDHAFAEPGMADCSHMSDVSKAASQAIPVRESHRNLWLCFKLH